MCDTKRSHNNKTRNRDLSACVSVATGCGLREELMCMYDVGGASGSGDGDGVFRPCRGCSGGTCRAGRSTSCPAASARTPASTRAADRRRTGREDGWIVSL